MTRLTDTLDRTLDDVRHARGSLAIYGKLVRRNLMQAVALQMPRTSALLGPRLADEVSIFCEVELPTSHFLRDVPGEFLVFSAPRWTDDPHLPAFLADLGRHELSVFDIAAAPSTTRDAEAQLFLERAVVFDGSVRIGRYDFAVHTIAGEPGELVSPRPTFLLGYRDEEADPRFLELTPFAAAILELLLRGETFGKAIVDAAQTIGATLDPTTLDDIAKLFSGLAERGILRGAGVGSRT